MSEAELKTVSEPVSKTTSKKIQVNFDAAALQVIDELREATGSKTTAEIIRDALGLYYWTLRMRNEGLSIGTIKDGRAQQEVILPFDLAI